VQVAADDQQADEVDRPFAEPGLELVAVLPVVELVKPVDDLTVPMIQAGRPLPRSLLPLPNKEAPRSGVLELNERESLASGVADGQIAGEIAE
jgi:hypothetical protein